MGSASSNSAHATFTTGLAPCSKLVGHVREERREILAAFPKGQVGESLGEVVSKLSFGTFPQTEDGDRVNQSLAFLKDHPREAFEALQNGLAKFGPKFPEERQFLVHFVGTLDIDLQTKIDFMANEIKRPVSEEDGQGFFNNTTALSSLMETTNNPSTLRSTIRDAVRSQANPQSRQLLLALYEQKDPEGAKRLKEDLLRD